jgi:hypothetical protein
MTVGVGRFLSSDTSGTFGKPAPHPAREAMSTAGMRMAADLREIFIDMSSMKAAGF